MPRIYLRSAAAAIAVCLGWAGTDWWKHRADFAVRQPRR